MTAPAETPRWKIVAQNLQTLTSGPTPAQTSTAEALSLKLGKRVPAPVAAVVLKHHLAAALLEHRQTDAEIPDVLAEIEAELRLSPTKRLITGTREEVSSWFAARYMLKTARGLRALKPSVGDIVRQAGWKAGEQRVISSIGDNGRIFMKGLPLRSAWPNSLEHVSRIGSKGYSAAYKATEALLLNAAISTTTNLDRFAPLEPFALRTHIPSPEAIRALEELLESGEHLEEPFQKLVTRHPSLLAAVVMGGWKTYVVPKPKLGSEYVPDFLVLGVNSNGPSWVTVEIEGARHPIVLQKGELHGQTRHAIQQIEDWRDWLTTNVAYVQGPDKGFHGLTNRAPGLVIIGRDEPSATRRSSRARTEEQARIAVHSWDWLLRNAQNLNSNALHVSDFAVENSAEQTATRQTAAEEAPDILALIDEDIDLDWSVDNSVF